MKMLKNIYATPAVRWPALFFGSTVYRRGELTGADHDINDHQKR
jgi:hypothetical protein